MTLVDIIIQQSVPSRIKGQKSQHAISTVTEKSPGNLSVPRQALNLPSYCLSLLRSCDKLVPPGSVENPYSSFTVSDPSVLSQIQENLTTGGRYSSHLSLGNLCPRETHPHCDSLSFWVSIKDILGHEIYKGHTRSWDLLLFKVPNDCFSLGIYSSSQCRLSLPIKCHFIIALYRSRVAWRHSWHSTFVSFPGSWARSTISNAYWERILFSLLTHEHHDF